MSLWVFFGVFVECTALWDWVRAVLLWICASMYFCTVLFAWLCCQAIASARFACCGMAVRCCCSCSYIARYLSPRSCSCSTQLHSAARVHWPRSCGSLERRWCRNIIVLAGVGALLGDAHARKDFDDIKKDLKDHGSGTSTYKWTGSSSTKRHSASVKCSSSAYASTYSGYVDSYIKAGTRQWPP